MHSAVKSLLEAAKRREVDVAAKDLLFQMQVASFYWLGDAKVVAAVERLAAALEHNGATENTYRAIGP